MAAGITPVRRGGDEVRNELAKEMVQHEDYMDQRRYAAEKGHRPSAWELQNWRIHRKLREKAEARRAGEIDAC